MVEWTASAETGFFSRGQLGRYDPSGVGLSFSGGGYRATLFHAGVVIRLNELGVLGRIDRISSVSGGSITSGILAMAWPFLDIVDPDDKASPEAMKKHFIKPILDATSITLDVGVGITGLLPFVSAGNQLANSYDKHIFKNTLIKHIPDRPKFIFNATNLQTQGLFRFTRDYLADWRALVSTTKKIRLSQAVAASSGFPPVLAPLRLDLSDEDVHAPEGARYNDPALRRRPVLMDGGVYDNLGMESIWKRCGVLIGSYAGQNNKPDSGNFSTGHLMTMINIFLASSIDWRERVLINLFTNELADGKTERLGAYWTAGTDIEDFPVKDGWKPTPAEFKTARDTPTRLAAFSKREQRLVINAGYAFADAGVRSYLMPDAPAPDGPPELP